MSIHPATNHRHSGPVAWRPLLAVLALAALLRFLPLPSLGPIHYDEGLHLMEARFLRTAVLHDHFGAAIDVDGLPLVHGKPLHAAILALAQTVLGDRPWVGSVAMGVFGLGSVGLCYALARIWFGQAVALWAALFLATNPWAVLYGRLALPEADSTFLALLGIYCAASGREPTLRRATLAGLCASLAMQTNYRWMVVLPLLFVGIELLFARARRSTRGLVGRVALFFLFLALPLLLTDFVYSALILGERLEQATRPRTYFEDLAFNVRKFSAQGWATGLRDPLRFPFFILRFGGPILAVATAVGLGAAWRRWRNSEDRETLGPGALLLCSLLPPVLLLISACGFPRCLSLSHLPWSIAAGLGLADLKGRLGRPVLAPALLVTTQLLTLPWVLPGGSGYGAVAAWLQARGDTRCLASQAYVLRLYGVEAVGIPDRDARLAEFRARGFRYLVVDNQVWTSDQTRTWRALERQATLVFEVPHPAGGSASFSYESPERSLAATWARAKGGDWLRPSSLRVYELPTVP
ncbi:MAG: glycosyltransferase family 39 protein [Candidatus Eisenbacteria bacterium]|nr:glycosyltransferase family 39 protein [Candidatus Eisenbacteria bacterium]MCC7142510.1 glycosyltransferase family 39 protein [Candidatus Eisenbacteria bacterium]